MNIEHPPATASSPACQARRGGLGHERAGRTSLRAVGSTNRKPACMPYGQEAAPVGGQILDLRLFKYLRMSADSS